MDRGKAVRRIGLSTLLFWGLALTWLLTSSRYTSYLRPQLWPLLVTGQVLAFASCLAFFELGDGHGRRLFPTLVRSGLLVLPLLFLLFGEGGTLGSYAFEKRKVGGSSDFSGEPVLPGAVAEEEVLEGGDAGELSVLDLVAAGREFRGKTVVVMGMVTRKAGVPDGKFALFRFVVTCCIADAQPVAVLVRHRNAAKLKEDRWVRVEGVPRTVIEGGRRFFLIEARAVEYMEVPDVPYLYYY